MTQNALYIIVALAVFASCKKDDLSEANPPISDIPSIELKSTWPTTVTEYEDSIIFTLSYIDGNGDLGFEDPDSLSLFLTDTRIPVTEEYYVQPLAPIGADIAIQGELKLKLDRTILVDDVAASETATFTLQIKDRAGNYSNIVSSPPITVLHN